MSSIYSRAELESTFINYISKGYAVVPLNGKRPTVEAWTELTHEECQDLQIKSNNTGLGILTGKVNNLIAIDIDTDDPQFLKEFENYCYSPISKKGKKGITYFFQYTEGMESKSFPPFVDFLCDGRQTVLPPSRHPETGYIYFWTEKETLLSMDKNNIPAMSLKDFEKLVSIAQKFQEKRNSDLDELCLLSKTSEGRNNYLVKATHGKFYDRFIDTPDNNPNELKLNSSQIIQVVADEIYKEDLEKHQTPLFSDKTEFNKTYNNPQLNALNFVKSNFKTYIKKQLKEITEIKSFDDFLSEKSIAKSNVESNKENQEIKDDVPFKYKEVPTPDHNILKSLYQYLEMRSKYRTHNIWVGTSLAALSAAIGHLAIVRTDNGDVGANLFALIIADSGLGKSMTINYVTDLLPKRLIHGGDFASTSGLYGFLRDQGDYSESLLINDEVSNMLESMKDGSSYQKGLDKSLINLYDKSRGNFILPIKAKSQQKTKEDAISLIEKPFVSTLFATNKTSFLEGVNSQFTKSGFGARFLYFNEAAHRSLLKEVAPFDKWIEQEKKCRKFFDQIEELGRYAIGQSATNVNLTGVKACPLVFTLDESASELMREIERFNDIQAIDESAEALKAIRNRKTVNLYKIALIHSFCRQFYQIKSKIIESMDITFDRIKDGYFKINKKDINFARLTVDVCLQNTEDMLQIAASNSKPERTRRDMIEAFKKHKFIPEKDLATHFAYLTPMELNQYKKELIERGIIKSMIKNKQKGYKYVE